MTWHDHEDVSSRPVGPGRRVLSAAAIIVATMDAGAGLAQPAAETISPAEHATATTEGFPRSIYVPYEHLHEVFELEGRGVFLPYEEFEALWQAAHGADPKPIDHTAPVDAVITETTNEATIARDVVAVKSVVRIELIKPGWHQVPLNLSDAAITRATIGDEPARIVYDRKAGYTLLYEHGDATCDTMEPVAVELKLEFAKAFTKTPGRNSVSFGAPPAPISRWRVTVPEAGVKVSLRPLIAATEIPAESAGTDETVVLAFVGAARSVGIDWTPKAEGATGLTAVASAQVEQRVWIEEGVSRVRADLAYTISRAEMPRLALEIPADHKVVGVTDANVRRWSVVAATEADTGGQRLEVELFEPARGTQHLRVELERFIDEGERSFTVPLVRAMDVARQQGVIVTRSGAGLRAEVTTSTGLVQLDAAELPEGLRSEEWPFSYRYATVPFSLVFDVRKIEPFITVDTTVAAHLSPTRLGLDVATVYHIERAGVFAFELDVPRGFRVSAVRGRSIDGSTAAEVDTFHLEGEGRTRLVVNLSRKAIGDVGLSLALSRPLEHPELLSPSEQAASIALEIPRATPAGIDQERGRLLVYAPDSLHVSPGRTSGLRSVAMAERAASAGSTAHGVLAFAYTDDPVELELRARRRQPYITVGQLLTARIDPGVVKYAASFNYDVRYSGVDSIRIDVPAGLASTIRCTTRGVRQERFEPAPDDVEPGFIAWRFTGESELLGERTVQLAWERTLERLDVGKSVSIEVPRLVPVGADRAWGQIVLAKSETIDVHAAGEPVGVRPIDPQHDLMRGITVDGAARAFEFHDAWSLAVTATHYELEDVKRTSVERALARVVLTRSDQVSVQMLYRIRSARQRLRVELPAGAGFDTQPLRIDGRPVTLERGDQGEYFVPLVGQRPDTPFVLELRYTVEDPAVPLELPHFPDEPAVQKVYLSVYLPPERTMLGSRGPWTDEMRWHRDGLGWTSTPRLDEATLMAWVSEGVNVPNGVGTGFQTDGRRYLFSTLRPEAPPTGSLDVLTMRQTLLSVLVFGFLTFGGVVLLRTAATARWVAVASLIVALVLVGALLPTFALEIMDAVLIAALFVVLVLWITWYLARTRPRDPFVQALKKARREAKLAAAAAAPVIAAASPIVAPGSALDIDRGGSGPTGTPEHGERNDD